MGGEGDWPQTLGLWEGRETGHRPWGYGRGGRLATDPGAMGGEGDWPQALGLWEGRETGHRPWGYGHSGHVV